MLLVLTVTPFISQLLATWARGGEVADLVELKTRGIGRLREDLRHAVVWTGLGQIAELPAFEGDETSMSFPVVSGLGPGATGIEYLSFRIGSGVNGPALVRRRAPLIGSSYGSFADPVVLFSGPYRYLFKYYMRDGEEIQVWNKGRMELPARIEVDIADRRGRLLLQLPIAIPTFASLSGACLGNQGLAGCPTVSPADADPAVQALLKKYGYVPPNQGN